ncbi:MAG: hypothetical protein DRH57_04240 [Candidatus Cloacimonadota bacterium]|nr:MAG: hypothetical protein DRH57_04240 [Candidatus Cloacimonadota bacterium]
MKKSITELIFYNNLSLLFLLLLFIFNSLFAQQSVTIYDIQYTTNPSGNSPYNGQIVTTSGIVTGTYEQYGSTKFFISEPEGGEWKGLFIYNANSGYSPSVGDEVQLTGEVYEYYEMTEIKNLSSFTILSSGNPIPTPLEVTTYGVATTEAYEGILVKVSNVVVNSIGNHGQWYVDDGTGQCQIDDLFDYSYIPVIGDILESITGLVDYAYGEYAINPRIDDDIVEMITNPSSGEINVYFTKSVNNNFSTGVNAQGDVDVAQKVIARFDSAQYSIDVAMYLFKNTNIANALISAYDRGVAVRVITEHDYIGETAIVSIQNAGITVIDDSYGANSGNYGMHNKFAIIDARDNTSYMDDWVLTGSYNYSWGAQNYNAENMIEIQDNYLASAYTIEFNEMWGSSSDIPNPSNSKFQGNKADNIPHSFTIAGKTVELYMGPTDGIADKIKSAIYSADNDIEFCIYAFTKDDIETAMQNRWNTVPNLIYSAVFDSAMANDPNSKYSDILAWNPVPPIRKSVGVVHSKYLIIDTNDETSDPIVTIGSNNWSNNGCCHNDENILIIHSDTLSNVYYQEFKKRYYEAPGITPIYDIQYTINAGDSTYPSNLEGENITITGIVTADSYNGNNFFVSDTSGCVWKGIYIYNSSIQPNVGDKIQLTGEVDEYYGLTEIKNTSSYSIISNGNPIPEPIVVNTGDLIYSADAEQYEGCLVKISNVIVDSIGNYGQWYVNDGTGKCQIDNGIYTYANPQVGDEFLSITAVVDYAYDEYGLNPRNADDLVLLELPPPQNVQIQIIGNEVHLSWDPVLNANIYKIYHSPNPYANFTIADSTSQTIFSEDISGIDKYFYRITADSQ